MNEGSATVGVAGDVFCGHNKGRLGLASAVSRGLSLRLSTNQPATGTTLQPPVPLLDFSNNYCQNNYCQMPSIVAVSKRCTRGQEDTNALIHLAQFTPIAQRKRTAKDFLLD
jgi:hypothetical protein